MELYAAVRRSVYVEGLSERAAARRFGLARETVRKMLRYRRPPGYRRAQPVRRPKLDAFTGIIDQILREDQSRPKKQRHTAKRIGERLRAEYGFTGGDTIVKAYVRAQRLGGQEMFVPLAHPPGDAQADFGEALVVIAGVECKAHDLVVDLPHSDDGFVQAFPAETTEAFCDGHNAAFGYFGGVPRRIVYDNTKLAVARILGDGTRQRTQVFCELQSHYLFADRFGRPGKGNDKGKVEGLVGYVRRNFFVPIPRFASWDALNADLAHKCGERRGRRLRRHTETIGERVARAREALLPLPPVPYDACDTRTTRVTSLSLVRYRRNDYSVPTAYGHREVLVKGYVDEVVIVCGSDEIARHRRSYEREVLIFEPRHYLALLERKTGALDHAAPLAGWQLPDEFLRLRRLSRYVVGWMLAPRESAALAERLIAATCAKQGIEPGSLTVHADRGAAMTSKPVALLLADLGVTKTHSRPHVSNDNPFSEAQFKTLKYCPAFPERFGSLADGRAFGHHFFGWYNNDHYHSGLGFLTPAVVHHGRAERVHAQRTNILAAAYAAHPERFVNGQPKPADLPQAVWINPPEKKTAAQDAPETTSGTSVDLQDPLISRSREHSAATTIDLGATLITPDFRFRCGTVRLGQSSAP